VAIGANDTQTVKAFMEAEAYDGPSLIIAYAHCIAHGMEIKDGLKPADQGGRVRPLAALPLRPARSGDGKFPLTLDSRPPKISFTDYAYQETRYRMLKTMDRVAAERLAEEAQKDIKLRWKMYEQLAAMQA
jgi:pyruvate-ferredoxin/flavodoxin oxidoreductase